MAITEAAPAHPDLLKAFNDFLGRPPDPTGLLFWTAQLLNGMPIDQIRSLIASSPEAQQRAQREIAAFYQEHLGRAPDEQGLAWYLNQFVQGVPLSELETMISSSPEATGLNQPPVRSPAYPGVDEDEAWVRNPQGGASGRGPNALPIGWPEPPDSGDAGVDDEDQTDAAADAIAALEEQRREESARSAQAALESAFPFIVELGLSQKVLDLARQGYQPDAILGELRQTTQWQEMFPEIRRADGTMRMTEGRYLEQMDEYREILRGFGMYDERYDSTAELAGFLAQEVDPTELEERLEIYSALEQNDDVRAAFYIYAGMRVSTDDLYQAVVDHRYRDNLANEYNARATMTNLDYDTWLTRTTEVAMDSLAKKMTDLEKMGGRGYTGPRPWMPTFVDDMDNPWQGEIKSETIDQIRSMNPEIAKQFIAVLHQGTVAGGEYLEDDALRIAFENAMLGSAAISQGLGLPNADRVEEIRAAGITRAQALKGYGQYAKDRNLMRSMARRAGFSGAGQDVFERSVFLSQEQATRQLEKASNLEQSYGRATQGSSFTTRGGRVRQLGLR